jgi:predicted membrane channel-forming protein YqfA (hemolysin III family)
MPPRPKTVRVRRSEAALRLGLILGTGLSTVAISWLLIANWFPAPDRAAMLRNLGAVVLAAVLMLIPVYRFRRHPSHVLTCGLTAWSILTLMYAILQIPFPRLSTRLGTFHFFILGAVLLALTSVLLWVIPLIVTLCYGPAVPARRRAH